MGFFVVDGSAVTQSGLVMDSFIQCLRGGRFGCYTEWFSDGQFDSIASWWTVRQLHRMV